MALVGVEELAHRGQPRDVQAQEGHQIRTGEGSLRHVEISQVARVTAPIIGEPRPPPSATTLPPPPNRSTDPAYYTLKREEPQDLDRLQRACDDFRYSRPGAGLHAGVAQRLGLAAGPLPREHPQGLRDRQRPQRLDGRGRGRRPHCLGAVPLPPGPHRPRHHRLRPYPTDRELPAVTFGT